MSVGSTTNFTYDAESRMSAVSGAAAAMFSPKNRREKPFHLRAGGVIICLRVQ